MKDTSQLNRPITGIILSFIAGILAGRYLPFLLFLTHVYLLQSGLLILTIFSYLKKKTRTVTILLFVLVFFFGVTHFCLRYYPSPNNIVHFAPSENPVQLVGRIVKKPRVREGGRRSVTFIMRALRIGCTQNSAAAEEKIVWQDVEGKIWIRSFYPYLYYGYGDIVRVEGKLNIPRGAKKRGEFDWRKYLSYQGIWTEMNTGRVWMVEQDRGNFILHIAFSFGDKIREVIEKYLPSPHSSVLKAIMLGDRDNLPSGVLVKFRASGTAHILVVSGLHVGLLAFIVFTFCRAIGVPRKSCYCLILPIIGFYTLVTGMRPPIMRAGLMTIVGVICYLLDREVPLLIILMLAAFIILIVNPLSLFTVSFQLSFTAVAGIVYLTPYLKEKFHLLPGKVRDSLSVSCAAQLSLFPLLAFYFHQFPLLGTLANLMVVPLITVILALGFLSGVLALFVHGAAGIIFNTNWLALHSLLYIVEFLSFSWNSHLALYFYPRIVSFPLWVIFTYYALLAVLPQSS